MGKGLRILAALAVTLLLAACVTTTDSVFTEKADPEKALERRVELARKYIGEGNWDNAKRNLKLAYELDPDNAEVHEAFALVYQSTGEFELAEQSYRTAIKLDRNFSRARNNYATFLYSQQRYEEAAAQLEFVVRDSLYKARPRAFVNLGLCRLQLFDSAGAEEAFRRALTMDRTNAIALLELAQLRFDADDFRTAQTYYDTYRTVVRQQSARGLWLGIRLARENDDRNAEGSYALALANLYPDSIEYDAYKRTR
ncbi:type IV pilus biogenesis/stability protein PilW [Seongchinamella sediminis]|uniref:Type IV pilus biogenesis/stability protein PilW n=1 Tax=Seongchinamella sediminis TaxID=2283635 RepID=A0A3L7E2R3_9GAMM|nr:type IV pilus biogenesis/stability protein PilW [Seongchinamella sediminis]RLQ23856.1 type IV pilus biogenesis/stability protein PilW [Seongchinamella sediminis]